MKGLHLLLLSLLVELSFAWNIYFNQSHAINCTVSNGGCNWESSFIWHYKVVPSSLNDDVYINLDVPYPILIIINNETINLGSLGLNGNVTLQIANSASLAIEGGVNIVAGVEDSILKLLKCLCLF